MLVLHTLTFKPEPNKKPIPEKVMLLSLAKHVKKKN